LLDTVISDLVSQLTSLYHEQLATEIIFLGEDQQIQQRISSLFNQNEVLSSELELHNIPQLSFMFSSDSAESKLIQQVNTFVEENAPDLQVFSFPGGALHKREFLFHHNYTNGSGVYHGINVTCFPSTSQTNCTRQITYNQMALFQISLWTPIVLVITFASFVYAMYSMNTGKDSLLYRSSSHQQLRPHE